MNPSQYIEDVVLNIELCPYHTRIRELYCIECRRLVCPDCECYKTHKLVNKSTLLAKNVLFLMDGLLMKKIRDVARTREAYYLRKFEYSNEQRQALESIRATAKQNLQHPETCLQQDSACVGRLRAMISAELSKAYTLQMRNTIETMLAMLDDTTELQEEVRQYEDTLETTKRRLKGYSQYIKKLIDKYGFVNTIRCTNDRIYLTEREKLAFVYVKEKYRIGESHVNTSKDNFEAFGYADHFVKRVRALPLQAVSEHVRISDGVPVSKLTATKPTFLCPTASISHNGVIGTVTLQDDIGPTVQLLDVISNRTVIFSADIPLVQLGFYDEMALLLAMDMKIQEIPVDDIFSQSSLSQAATLGKTKEFYGFADVSIIQDTRILRYSSSSNQMYEYGLDTKENIRLSGIGHSYGHGSCTGICMKGTKAVYSDITSGYLMKLDNDGLVAPILEAREFWEVGIIPSDNQPAEISQALVIVNDKCSRGGKLDYLPMELHYFASLARVWHDCFLLFDGEQWLLRRVSV